MLFVVLACLLLLPTVSGRQVTSSGTKGTICSNDRRKLCPLVETECQGGHCVCRAGMGGVPGLQCKEKDTFGLCSLTNDPVTYTFTGIRADSPVPCNVLFVEASYTEGLAGVTCGTKVFTFSKRINGKMYLGGFEVRVIITSPAETVTLGFKALGSANDGIYTYDLLISKDNSAYTATWNDADYTIFGMAYTFSVDMDTNRVVLDLSKFCNFVVKFRAVDEKYSVFDQSGVPGLSLMFHQSLQTDKQRVDLIDQSSLCMGTGNVYRYLPFNRGITSELIRRSYNPDVPQDFPNASPECSRTDLFDVCPDEELLSDALNDCEEVYEEPPFINCYSGSNDPSSDRILALFRSCVKMSCEEGPCPTDIKTVVDTLSSDCLARLPRSLAVCKTPQIVLP